MSEGEKDREHLPSVIVSVPTKDEMLAMHRRMYGDIPLHESNLGAFRLLRCGSKEMLFKLGFDQGSTLLLAKEGAKQEKISGETTELYREVKRIIEEHVQVTGRMYTYELRTEHEAMLAWARSAGKEVFTWDQEIPARAADGFLQGPVTFVKSFFPRR